MININRLFNDPLSSIYLETLQQEQELQRQTQTYRRIDVPKERIFENKRTLRIHNQCDVVNFKTIQVKNPTSNFQLHSLKVKVGIQTIIDLDMDFCSLIYKNDFHDFKEEFEVNNNRIINFNLPMNELRFKDVISCISLMYHNIELELIYDGDFEATQILSYDTYLQTEMREIFATQELKRVIYQLQKIELTITENDQNTNDQNTNVQETNVQETTNQNKSFNLPFSNMSNGLFLMGIDMNNINEIKIITDGILDFNITKYNHHAFMRKLNEYDYYLPLDNNFDFNDTNIQTNITQATNFSRLDNFQIEFNFNNSFIAPNRRCFVGVKSYNIFKSFEGIGGTFYSLGGTFYSINDDNNNENQNNNLVITGDGSLAEYLADQGYPNSLMRHWQTYTSTNFDGTPINNPTILPINEVVINKLLEGDDQCPIFYKTIEPEDEYLCCETCHKNLSTDVLNYIQQSKKCPMCRSQWHTIQIYKHTPPSPSISSTPSTPSRPSSPSTLSTPSTP